MRKRIVVWDAPVRMFHWTLVLLIALMWWTGEKRMLDWHRLAGYAVLALLLFRLGWGVAGSSTARFASFVRAPRAVADYVCRDMFSRGRPPHVGHNPLGGWSVVGMLVMLLGQVGLGLFAVDVDGLESGPFSYLVDFRSGRLAAEFHQLVFDVLLGIMALHILAALFYLVWRRDNLIVPMLSGRRFWTGRMPALVQAPVLRAALLFVLSALLVWGVIAGFGQA